MVSWVFFAVNAKPTSMRKAVAQRLAERERVVVVERAVSVVRERRDVRLSARCTPLLGTERGLLYRAVHLPEALPGLNRVARWLNDQRLSRELNGLRPPNATRVVCFDSPDQERLVGKVKSDISVYLAIDDRTLTVWGEPIQGELEAEQRLLEKVDKVVCVSEPLAAVLRSRMRSSREVPVHVLPNGYDERLFSPENTWPEPAMLTRIPRPRILVAGHVSERIDWEGVAAASRFRPEWTWVFVGPSDTGIREKIDSISASLGSKWSGSRVPRLWLQDPVPVEEMPALIAHSDACAVPYRLNVFTTASSPLKALEYLAMGAPVLSTRVPSLSSYGSAIEWVEEADGESYARALDVASAKARDAAYFAARRQAVRGDSWATRASQFRDLVLGRCPTMRDDGRPLAGMEDR